MFAWTFAYSFVLLLAIFTSLYILRSRNWFNGGKAMAPRHPRDTHGPREPPGQNYGWWWKFLHWTVLGCWTAHWTIQLLAFLLQSLIFEIVICGGAISITSQSQPSWHNFILGRITQMKRIDDDPMTQDVCQLRDSTVPKRSSHRRPTWRPNRQLSCLRTFDCRCFCQKTRLISISLWNCPAASWRYDVR